MQRIKDSSGRVVKKQQIFSFSIEIAKRFLFSQYSDAFFPWMTWVSVTGVALGVMALTVVMSVMNGFEGELKRVITQMNGEVLLYSKGESLHGVQWIQEKIYQILPEAEAVTASYLLQIMSLGPQGTSGAILEGVDLETLGSVTTIPQHVVKGRLPQAEGEVALGLSLAERLGAQIGSEIRIMIPLLVEQGQASVLKSTVVGMVQMGMHDYDSKLIFAPLKTVQNFLKEPDSVTNFHIKLKSNTSRAAAARLKAQFEYPFYVKDWTQLNRNLFYAIELEKIVIAIILIVIVIVAAFNVVGTLMMMIQDKMQEMTILKVMGLKKKRIFWIFCCIGLMIGGVGIGLGLMSGLCLVMVLQKTRWILLPPEIYYLDFLPVAVSGRELCWIIGVAWMIIFIATFFPAWMIAHRSPLKGLCDG